MSGVRYPLPGLACSSSFHWGAVLLHAGPAHLVHVNGDLLNPWFQVSGFALSVPHCLKRADEAFKRGLPRKLRRPVVKIVRIGPPPSPVVASSPGNAVVIHGGGAFHLEASISKSREGALDSCPQQRIPCSPAHRNHAFAISLILPLAPGGTGSTPVITLRAQNQ